MAHKQQSKAMQEQSDTANRLAEETRAEAAAVKEESKKNAAELAAAPAIAAEEARKEDMKRRAKQTKTLLTGPLGTSESATVGKKTLLGA